MKIEIEAIINDYLSFLRQEDKDELISKFIELLNPVLKEVNKLKVEKDILETKIKSLQLEVGNKYSELEIDKLKQENNRLKSKIIFLNDELENKFKKGESKTIAFQLGDSIIQGIKNPQQGIKRIPNTTAYLVKESIARRSKKKSASKLDRLLNIILEDNSHRELPKSSIVKKISNQVHESNSEIRFTNTNASDMKDKVISKKILDRTISKENPLEIVQKVKGDTEYLLTVNCHTDQATNTKGAVANITFYDKNKNILPKPYIGTNSSKLFEAYFYITTFNKKEAEPRNYTIKTPETAVEVNIKLVAFDSIDGFILTDGYQLDYAQDKKKGVENSNYLEMFNEVLLEAKDIPDSNGSEYFVKHNYRVGVIGDVYMYNFYKDVFTTVNYLSPSNYQEVLDQGLDIIIYTTCWKGINNEEWRGVKFREIPKNALDNILSQSKEKNIKTVFQTIEDPSNFEYFLPLAEKFEYVFTTDIDCIDRYKNVLKHDRVFYGEYGVNPQFNNPIGSRRNIRNAAFFAGSYPMRYAERCKDMEIIFDSILESDGKLLIADRNFDSNSEELNYPVKYQSSVLPPIQHSLLQKVHKLFRYNLNFNSIKQSPTMCAMRVYELQAQGNGLISNYANSVYNKFPGIRIIPFKQNMSFDFSNDTSWEEYRNKTNNIREVLNTKTSYQVVAKLLKNIGLSSEVKKNKTVAVICFEKTESIMRSFERQSYQEKIIIEESELINWNYLENQHDIGYFCWFSDESEYEKYYINDLLNAFKYTNSSFITKDAYFNNKGVYISGKEHEYTDYCNGKNLSLFSTKYFDPKELSSYKISERFICSNGYCIDPFEINYITHMHSKPNEVNGYDLSVIVPVYNNARYLVSKCIPSLQRNNIWPKMEVLLIDDGSTDVDTLETLNNLELVYPNIKVVFNHGNGSGSASRPRNQGIDIAQAAIVTFLDPDNEISPGGYDLLVDLYHKANVSASEPVEFISGYHVKVSEDVKTIGKHTANELSVIKDFKKGYFSKGRFPVIATQSAVISKKMLNDNNIRFVEGSAGQDTLFGWELIANSKCGGFNGEAYILYYADRSDSITNVVNKNYFIKKLILEKEQKSFLFQHDLLESFMESRFEQFIEQWYLKKLDFVDKDQRDDCIVILDDICKIYNKSIYDYI